VGAFAGPGRRRYGPFFDFRGYQFTPPQKTPAGKDRKFREIKSPIRIEDLRFYQKLKGKLIEMRGPV
jgi:hypothetical protein